MCNTDILVTFIIPCYNVSDYIADCLDSMLNIKSKYAFQIICVNDGSTDNTLSILKTYQKNFSNFILIDQSNKGLSEARNVGLSKAMGKWVAFVDSDDMIVSEGLTTLFTSLVNSPAQVICTEYYNLEKNNLFPHTSVIPHIDHISGIEFLQKYYFSDLLSMVWRYFYKRDFLERNKLLFTKNIYFEDMEFTPRALAKADYFEYLKIYTYCYRTRESSIMSSSFSAKKFNDSFIVAHNNLCLVTDYPQLKNIMLKSARYTALRAISFFPGHKKDINKNNINKLIDISKRYNDKLLICILKTFERHPKIIKFILEKYRTFKSI